MGGVDWRHGYLLRSLIKQEKVIEASSKKE
jgi:hypothetical protein